MEPASLVREALADTGVDLVASCPIGAFDAAAPEKSRSAVLMPGARGVIVAASAGPALWRAFRARMAAEPALWELEHPYDAFVATILARGDAVLSHAGIGFRRFEAAFHATPRMDFLALSRLTGLGHKSPFLLHIHPKYGPWWALRGAWLVDAEVAPPLSDASPCVGCPAPCVGGWENAGGIVRATAEVRGRCVVGQEHRYDDDQIAYHYDRQATRERLGGGGRP